MLLNLQEKDLAMLVSDALAPHCDRVPDRGILLSATWRIPDDLEEKGLILSANRDDPADGKPKKMSKRNSSQNETFYHGKRSHNL